MLLAAPLAGSVIIMLLAAPLAGSVIVMLLARPLAGAEQRVVEASINI